MTTRVTMPKLGESVTEGTVARWLKRPGERVEKLEPLLEISTDKIDTEIPSPAAGQLLEVRVAEGQTVAVGALLALIGVEGESAAAEPEPVQRAAAPAPAAEPAPAAQPRAAEQPSVGEQPAGRGYISPVVQRLAAEHNVDLAQVPGTGMDGRITKQDVLAWLEGRTKDAPAPAAAPAVIDAGEDETLTPLSAMRRTIAAHMVKSVATAPHVTTIFEVEMTAVLRHREAFKAQAAQRGVPLTFTPYVVAAAAQALRAHPLVNSRFTEAGIVTSRRIHIGVAVAVDGGLLVPVVHDADELALPGLARAVADLAQRARTGGLHPDDLAGGTFTITNHGVGGSLIGTPIIAQPQSAILGVGAIVKRPVVVSVEDSSSLLPGPGDALVIRPMAYLSLTFDHRLLDGAAADAFVATIKQALEAWPSENSNF